MTALKGSFSKVPNESIRLIDLQPEIKGCPVTGFKVPSKEEAALSKCSTEHAPWFIIPSNHKWFRNFAISKIVSEALESLGMKFPAPTVDINEIKQKYHAIVAEEGDGEQAELKDQPNSGKGKKEKQGKKGKKPASAGRVTACPSPFSPIMGEAESLPLCLKSKPIIYYGPNSDDTIQLVRYTFDDWVKEVSTPEKPAPFYF